MKIALIVPGGVDRSGRYRVIPHILWLIENLSRNHEVCVISLYQYPEPRNYELLGAKIFDLGNIKEDWSSGNSPHIVLAKPYEEAVNILGSNGPFDVIHGLRGTQPGWLAGNLGQYLNIPSVVSLLGGELHLDPNHYLSQLVKEASYKATCLTVASNYMVKVATSQGISAKMIPFGVHNSCFQPTESQNKPPWRLLSVADINPVKNYAMMLHAMKNIVNEIPRIHLDIIGVDTLNGKIHALSDELGLTNHVTFHGFLPNDAIRRFFQKAHIYLVTSRHEGGPVAMLEAAACGVPTVGTSVGYVADWADKRAIAAGKGDPDAIAEGIINLLSNSSRRTELGTAARNWARIFDSTWTTKKLLQLYRSIRQNR